MSEPIRLCLFDGDQLPEGTFRAAFQDVGNLLIMGEASNWDELKEYIRHGRLDCVVVNLGDGKEHGLAIVRRIAEMSPGCAIIGISRCTDPQAIIAAMRSGCSQFVTWPIEQSDLASALERIQARVHRNFRVSRRICVISASGGAGATTVACNLAMELAHLVNRRCGLVDLNLEFGDVAGSFDCTPTHTIADICRQQMDIDRILLGKALYELPCEVSLLSRPEKLEEVHEVTPEAVSSTLEVLGEMFPYVVVDLPRTFSFLAEAALTHTDYVLIVTQLGVPFIRNATRIYDAMLQRGAPDGCVEIVVNRCNANFERITPEEVEAHFGQPIFAMIPNDYRRVQSSLDLGHPIVTDAPASPARLAIQQMAKRLAGGSGAEPPAAPVPSGGLFGKFWRRGAKSGT